LIKANFISLTTDCWTSTDAKHSLLSVTAHFINEGAPKFVVLAAKPIKGQTYFIFIFCKKSITGRHTAKNLGEIMRQVFDDYSICESKIFVVVRDSAEVMVKLCADLRLKSSDCFAHKLNLVGKIFSIFFHYFFKAIWDGIRLLNNDDTIKNIIERIKRFVRKIKKSPIQREEFENVQKALDLPKKTLIKDSEVVFAIHI
jgi:hypothetical protein